MAWSIAYETTALGLSPFGGMATVCRHTLSGIKSDGRHQITGYFRHGRGDAISATGAPARRWRWYSQLTAPACDLHHGLCHRLLPLRARVRVLTVYDAWSLYPNPYQSAAFQRRAERVLRKALTDSDCVVTSSEATRTKLLKQTTLSPDRITVIYPGTAAPTAAPTAPIPLSSISLPFVLFVGRLETRKNLRHVVEAVRPIPELHLVVVGEPGFGYESDAEPALRELPQHRLSLIPVASESELCWLYQNAVAVLQPSWEEGFGLPVLEALAAGCPVITSNCSATAEIAGSAAMLVNPGNPAESTHYLEILVNDPTARSRWRDSALARSSEFTWERYRRQLVELYAQLLH